jgi:adenine-specific DNA glycosylase
LDLRPLAPRRHVFTHFLLHMRPLEILLEPDGCRVMDGNGSLWYNPDQPAAIGIPAPIARLIGASNASEEST